ncbi:hypothetical protein SEA_GODPOWER_55 [Streptomyces phage Godpower]|uniref:Uncharacterized protein n=2 Tax=Likavirus TaxID=1982880 RepID=A0A1C9LWS3_9CAUD|nr:hypothetical protein M050_gp54 [Streptomyces phage Sujidade]AGM12152.1 hypothetical protein SUJIDADE_54 [Streptomyces phage Sujidade]AOQ27030.1 hypothetical protein SEA_GODPOWER_55 [Streptomyces phage Godpower]
MSNGWNWVNGEGRGNGDPATTHQEVPDLGLCARIIELESEVKRWKAIADHQYALAQSRATRIFELQGELARLREPTVRTLHGLLERLTEDEVAGQ